MSEQSNSASVSPAVIGWSIAAFACSIFIVMLPMPYTLGAGFFTKCFVVILGTITGTAGAFIGRFIKGIIGAFIGVFIGACVAASIVLGIH